MQRKGRPQACLTVLASGMTASVNGGGSHGAGEGDVRWEGGVLRCLLDVRVGGGEERVQLAAVQTNC